MHKSIPQLRNLLVALALAVSGGAPARAQGSPPAITEAEAHAIAVDAYIYFYSIISMDVTRRQATNVEPGKMMLFGPANIFSNAPAFPAADFKAVVRPNFDTLYSSGWLNMTKEPVIVSAPDTGGRYYLLPMLDMWSDVSHLPAGAPLERRRPTIWSRRRVGAGLSPRG